MSDIDKTRISNGGDIPTMVPSNGDVPTVRKPQAQHDSPVTVIYTHAHIPATLINPNITVRSGDASLSSSATVMSMLSKSSGTRYAIDKEIARGGMGAILRAADADIRREVAIKVMLRSSDEASRRRFVEEAQITGQLEHPNIVPVHEIALDEQNQIYFTMKLVQGRSLRQILADVKSKAQTASEWTQQRLLRVLIDVCNAMAFAHSKGVIHRDLKPDNVMLGKFGEVLVMDWGLAKVLDAHEVHVEETRAQSVRSNDRASMGSTMEGEVMGTPSYMSPEQADGRISELDAGTDVYALGAILYEILAQIPPIDSTGGVRMIIERAIKGNIVAPEKRVASRAALIPKELSAIAMKALAKRKQDRYTSALKMRDDIQLYLDGHSVSAKHDNAWELAVKLIKRNKAVSITVGGAVAALLMLGIVSYKINSDARTKAEVERNRATENETQALAHQKRAEAALADLRGTAPTFAAQAQSLTAEGKLDEAVTKIGYAASLVPDNADYLLTRANLLQATQKLTEAVTDYRRVLAIRPNDVGAKTNLELCNALIAENGGKAELTVILQAKLLDALIAQQRDLEAAPLSKLLNRDTQDMEATIRARLSFYTKQAGWENKNISRWKNGFDVKLRNLQLGDLLVLRGLPITNLNLDNTSVSDLRPLVGLPLDELWLNDTRVTDLSPLRGMKLRRLGLQGTPVSDLSPLSDIPLKELYLFNCSKVSDLKPIAGHQLEILDIGHCENISDLKPLDKMPLLALKFHNENRLPVDFSPLAKLKSLEKISLPTFISDIAFLSSLPNLQQVEWHPGNTPYKWMPARDFIAMYGPDVPEIKAVRAALATVGLKNLPIERIAVDPDHQLRLRLFDLDLADLKPLKGLPIKELGIQSTKVSDLEPLRGMRIKELVIGQTAINDLEPLRGMPIEVLNIDSTRVRNLEPLHGMPLRILLLSKYNAHDVGVLADLHNLEQIRLSNRITNVESLRTLPKLRYISDEWNDAENRPAQTAQEFWKVIDAKNALAKIGATAMKTEKGWDVLTQITQDYIKKTGNGWSLKDGELFSPEQRCAILPLSVNLSDTSYRLRLKLRRVAGDEVFHVVLPLGDHMTGFELDGWAGKYSGLQLVNGAKGKDVPGIIEGRQIKDAEPHVLELTVRLTGANVAITATLDSRPYYEWTGPAAALGENSSWSNTEPGCLAIGSCGADWAVSEVNVKLLEKTP